jgi:Flp pilus assembly pilin Flp
MNNTQITTKSSAIRTFFRTLRRDRRGAELVEILIALAVVALGGIAAMNAIQKEVDGKGKDVAEKIKNDIKTP